MKKRLKKIKIPSKETNECKDSNDTKVKDSESVKTIDNGIEIKQENGMRGKIFRILETKDGDNLFKFKSVYAENTEKMVKNFYSHEPNKTKELLIYGLKTNIDTFKGLTFEPPFTFYADQVSTLDYIFYEGNIEVIGTYDIPNLELILKNYNFFPNNDFPSDHLSMAADFYLK